MVLQKIKIVLRISFGVLFLVMTLSVSAQRYVVDKSVITFFSEAAIENIAATNSKGSCIFDIRSNAIAFSVPINQFQFEKKLMQEHFNEKYMESDKYPTATFSGVVDGFQRSNATNKVVAKGKLNIHGVTKNVTIPGTIEISDQGLILKTKFMVKLDDYKVKIPRLLWQNIAEEVEVSVNFTLMEQ
jgi:polyisoprenoid-binding protein YceI